MAYALPSFVAASRDPRRLADCAVSALIDEACLTPKPALVDQRGSGAHSDLDLGVMIRSAHSLRPTFLALARAAMGQRPSQLLREQLARIGREGEIAMLRATGGGNAHRGAIWIVGLLCAAAAMNPSSSDAATIASLAASIARFDDRFAPASAVSSNGNRAVREFGAAGARGQANAGFPHVVNIALPALLASRARGASENEARLDALIALIATLDDTCLLHRGGREALGIAQSGARRVMEAGGVTSVKGRQAFAALDRALLALNASPGGAADLLAATLFVDALPRVG